MQTCPFCLKKDVVVQNDLAKAFYDGYPVSPGHILIVPKRHIKSLFEATKEERIALWELLSECKRVLDERNRPDGFNIGINDGTAAGQTVMHLHIHLIPRHLGDMEDPKGGVRGVIPSKQKY